MIRDPKSTPKKKEGGLDEISDISPVTRPLLRHTNQLTNQNRQTDDGKIIKIQKGATGWYLLCVCSQKSCIFWKGFDGRKIRCEGVPTVVFIYWLQQPR